MGFRLGLQASKRVENENSNTMTNRIILSYINQIKVILKIFVSRSGQLLLAGNLRDKGQQKREH